MLETDKELSLSDFESDESELLDKDSDAVVSTVSVCTTFGVDSTKIVAFPGVAGVAGVVDNCAACLLPP